MYNTTVPLSYTLVQEYFPSLGLAKAQLHALAGSLQGCTPRLEKHTAIFSGWVVGEKNAMYAVSCQTELKHQIKTLAARTTRLHQDKDHTETKTYSRLPAHSAGTPQESKCSKTMNWAMHLGISSSNAATENTFDHTSCAILQSAFVACRMQTTFQLF